MAAEVNELVSLFLEILRMFSVIEKQPWESGTGKKVYLAEMQTIAMIGENPEINMTRLADHMGVTRGAISQVIRKLVAKKLVVRTNHRNQKEINLGLTDSGLMVHNFYLARMREVFTFADELYATASPADRELVKRLFVQIQANMKNRIKET
jgi:DNA-binding MarR family transcriptional regulator